MSQQVQFRPAGVVLPGKKEAKLMASMIKRPPARRLAEALIAQFPDLDIKVRDGGFTVAAMRNGVAVMLCEQYEAKRDLREGWWTLVDSAFPQLVAFLTQVSDAPSAANEPSIEEPDAPANA